MYFYKEAPMEQLKRKELKEEEVVCSYIDTETREVKYTLRERDSIRVILENKKNIERTKETKTESL